jgi:hypothetical protein
MLITLKEIGLKEEIKNARKKIKLQQNEKKKEFL